ncbi:uncharacterized protein LOC133176154 isoform X2 [Saccostrea echinata]|uniref:uncharacterized protein LOC133176154 isoform X2 n=1 Tax=Saccostrea echinata TaxID=191078 RepID=UPI002A82330B|nr:uncharacterized protein LOC133176154 isoform X2 [Saccostrea echinata]
MSRWNLYDPDFYDEIVPFGSEGDDDKENDEGSLICTCYGRGKKLSEVDVPRVPQLQFQIEKQKYLEKLRSSDDPNSRKVGRGRARIRQKLGNTEIPSVGQSQSVVPNIPLPITNLNSSNISQQANCGGFGRPRFPVEEDINYDDDPYMHSSNQPTRRGFSLEDFMSQSGSTCSTRKKKNKNKSSTGSIYKSSTDHSDRCTSPENNEEVAVLDTSAAEHTVDGYLLSKMLNIPFPTGNTVAKTGSQSVINNFEDITTTGVKISKKKELSKKSSIVDNEEEEGWRLSGENVIEFSDLPGDCDISLLRDLIAAYGSILESDLISLGSTVSVRYKLDSCEAAEWVVSNLHSADYLFQDYSVKCRKVIQS